MKKLIYFTASWCKPCATLGPVMQQVAQVMNVIKIDIDQDKTTPASYGVRSVPTVILVENGLEVSRKVGVHPYSAYINM